MPSWLRLAEFAVVLFKQVLAFLALDENAPSDEELRAAAADVLDPKTARKLMAEMPNSSGEIPPPVRPSE